MFAKTAAFPLFATPAWGFDLPADRAAAANAGLLALLERWFTPPHIHPNNLISGVYYLQTPPSANAIVFHDPRPQAHLLQPVAPPAVADLQSEIQIEAKPGRLLLFPSWLRHSVQPNFGNEERISISFNVTLDDYAATDGAPGWKGFREDGTRA